MATRSSVVRVATSLLLVALLAGACTPAARCTPTRKRKCPRPPATASPTTTAPRRPAAEKTSVFSGLGSWADVYDWSPSFSSRPRFTVDRVDALADAGVQVLFIQSAKANRPEELLDPTTFAAIVARAKARGLRVVSWYLPAHLDSVADVRRLVAPLKYGVDGIAMDIESTDQKDIDARNRSLTIEAVFTRAVLPDVAMAAIVLPPVVTDVLNLNYWPRFPWTTLAPVFDAWMPMGYWTNRTPESGYRNGESYTNENIDRLRANLGLPNAPVHPVGGIADKVTAEELAGFVASAQSRQAIGGSLYDDTTGPALYAQLQPLRR